MQLELEAQQGHDHEQRHHPQELGVDCHCCVLWPVVAFEDLVEVKVLEVFLLEQEPVGPVDKELDEDEEPEVSLALLENCLEHLYEGDHQVVH